MDGGVTLRRRRLGRTGLEVSELAFGGGWVGGVLIHRDEDTRRAALARALEAGINLIDTAPSYGDGESERTLGRLLGSFDRAPYVATKARSTRPRSPTPPARSNAAWPAAWSACAAIRWTSCAAQPHRRRNRFAPRRGDRVLGDVADALDGLRAQGLVGSSA